MALPDMDDTDAAAGMSRGRMAPSDSGFLESSADCSECMDDCADDWPPRKVS